MTIERIHGLHAVRTLLERHPTRVHRVHLARGREDEKIVAILRLAEKTRCPIDRVESARLDSLAGGGVHQGVVAEVQAMEAWDEDQLIAALAASGEAEAASGKAGGSSTPLVLVLDGVQDPHNLGACLRTADACGALAVVIPKDRAAPFNATVRKVAAGAAETTPVVRVTNLARALRDLKSAGLWVVGAEAAAARETHEVDLAGPVALVLGAEGSGLRQLTRQHCDVLVRLPALGAVESLNVSVAAGMLLYEAVRQRRAR